MDRVIAFVLGMICFICTLIILFSHIRSLDDLTVIHLYITVSFIVSVGAGYYMWHANFVDSVAFALIFLVSTGVCVTLSGSRSYASLEKKIKEADARAAQRDAITAEIKKHQPVLDRAQRALDAHTAATTAAATAAAEQCTASGRRCEGAATGNALREQREQTLTRTRDEARAHLDALTQKLETYPPLVANEELRPLAALYSTITGADERQAMSIVIIILAYSLAVLTEFSGVTFMNYSLHSRKKPAPLPAPTPSIAPAPVPTPQTVSLAEIARDLNIDPRIARKRVRELGVQKPIQGWTFSPEIADALKTRLSSLH